MTLFIRDLAVDIQGSQILRGIEIEVGRGELVCLVGRNGAGKTTTLRTVMGFIRPRSGEILANGEPTIGMATHSISRLGVGYSPEESEVFTSLSVAQNIEMPTWVQTSKRSASERVDAAFSVFPKLRGYVARRGGQLSGGERKMLSIARALAQDPKLLLLDEPFEGLSPAIIPEIGDSLLKIVNLGMTVLQAESNLHHVPKFASRLYVIERGEIIFTGSLEAAKRDKSVLRVISGED